MSKKVCIIGSGKWGSAVAKLVAENVSSSSTFNNEVKLFVYQELFEGRKLTDVINHDHVNPMYLPNVTLPSNILAVSCPREAAKDADIIIFILRQQFLGNICEQMQGAIKRNAIAISLTKSLYHGEKGNEATVELKCASDVIYEKLNLKASVLMGPNLADEIAKEKFSETTIACPDTELWTMWKELFHCKYFNVKFSKQVKAAELCGALKNVVAAAAGLSDGLDCGKNSKAAIIRLGFLEMKKFIKQFIENVDDEIFWEPCGFPDLVATCYGGMTRLVVDAYVKSNKTLREVEIELFHGNYLEGPINVKQVYVWLINRGGVEEYPLLRAVYGVFHENKPFQYFVESLKSSF